MNVEDYLQEALEKFDRDPPDTDFQRGYLAALKAIANEATATGYRGFSSKEAYEAHYSDPAKYADEIQAMDDYTREAEAERRDTGCA
jgi:hypothetical protein